LVSVAEQTLPATQIIVVTDTEHDGAAVTRNRGLNEVDTEFTALLDDDDRFLPHHLETCVRALEETGADLVYPWFDVLGGNDVLGMFGKPFDAEQLRVSNYIPVTVVARTNILRQVGGFIPHPVMTTHGQPCEDWQCWLNILDAGGKIVHVPERTWLWSWENAHTSGRGDRW
jgi:hypothetical protein